MFRLQVCTTTHLVHAVLGMEAKALGMPWRSLPAELHAQTDVGFLTQLVFSLTKFTLFWDGGEEEEAAVKLTARDELFWRETLSTLSQTESQRTEEGRGPSRTAAEAFKLPTQSSKAAQVL